MKLLRPQKDSPDGRYRDSECEHIDDDGRRHVIHTRTSDEGRHNIVVDYGGINNIGYDLTDDGLVAFLARLFGRR